MNSFDIAILGVMAAFLLKGALRGLLKEVCSLLGLVVGGFLAFRYQGPLGEVLMKACDWPAQVCVVLAFLALFLSSIVLFGAIGFLLSRFVKLVFLGGLNRVAGGFFGLAQGVLLLAIVLFALSLRPLPGGLTPVLRRSQLAPPLVTLGKSAMNGSRSLLHGGR
ncbi:colicin V production protein [Geothermobacter hydrogeniphilus]|uniref:Colicin V production protein n=1 Tax=Geothermobacter hydrogeniphilus TaxID=1969733 RepID=A0A2K2HA18_9BACT|nr:CvpA family protein [Geothermobacter hydrogeniphilus]PNU20152.1 colicin V production protein [Geothermobacter hydrogeniphilus]